MFEKHDKFIRKRSSGWQCKIKFGFILLGMTLQVVVKFDKLRDDDQV
jgi:hypothetical protein